MTDSTRAKNALMPCPFCGGEAYVEQERHGCKHYVGCKKSSCLGFSGLGWMYETEKEAIAAWNTRHERTCNDISESYLFECSECGFGIWDIACSEQGIDYCPHCGAKVVSE